MYFLYAVVLRSFLFGSFVLSLVYSYFAIIVTDACYTSPCLNYAVNPLRVSVASSVSTVIFSIAMVIAPIVCFYFIVMRCRPFAGGVVNGMLPIISLISWIESVACMDEYVKLSKLSNDFLLIFGNGYLLNQTLFGITRSMSILSFCIAILNTLASLLLYCYRHQYCVEYPAQVRSRNRKYHNINPESEDENNF